MERTLERLVCTSATMESILVKKVNMREKSVNKSARQGYKTEMLENTLAMMENTMAR